MRQLLLACVALAAASVAACVNTAPQWDSTFGDASRQARALQVINPDAPSQNTASPPTDGKAAAGAQTRYSESYGYAVKEGKQPALSITNTGGR